MMSKIEFDVNAMILTVSKKFWNNASVPFSPEYDMIKRIRQDYPCCRIVVRKRATRRNSCKNPTYDEMMLYIEEQPNAIELMDEFQRIRKFSSISGKGYSFVRNWFMGRCPMNSQFDSSCYEANYTVA